MAADNSITKNRKTNIIVITANDQTLQNFLSIIQKSEHCDDLSNITRHVITESTEDNTKVSYTRRRADLTCVICEDKCSGYNFNVISCASCKSFFHRNASQNVNDFKCLTNTNKCDIKFKNTRRMCRRCRLVKCLSVGMKPNSVDKEAKLYKQQQLEQNRQSTKNASTTHRSLVEKTQLNNEESTRPQFQTGQASSVQRTILSPQKHFLTLDDCNRLNSVKLSYEVAFRSTGDEHDISALARLSDRRSALVYIASAISNVIMKLITFIRNIAEFKLFNEQNRFMLVKYNLPLVFSMSLCLNYDANRDIVIHSNAGNEEYDIAFRQLSCYCYGTKFDFQVNQLLRSTKEITDDDPIILQLMLITLTFAKRTSLEDMAANEQLILMSNKQVYKAQSIYTTLLFRYMIRKYSSYYQAAHRYSQLIQKIIQTQMLVRTYQHFLQEQLGDTNDEEVDPVTKSIFRLR